MTHRVGWLVMVICILLLGCSLPLKAIQPNGTPTEAPSSPVPTSLGQKLPISARANFADKSIDLEVANTPQQQAIGLMYRTSLADDRGMLFPFDPPKPVNFWMMNVAINLDMIFLRDGEVKAIAANVPPCTATPCPIYGPGNTLIDQVIELRGGRAAELGLKQGDRITIQFLKPDRQQPSQTPR